MTTDPHTHNPTSGYSHLPIPPQSTPVDKGAIAAHFAMAMHFSCAGKLIYTEGSPRSGLYDRVKAGLKKSWNLNRIITDVLAHLATSEADCSQFVAAGLTFAGFTQYTDHDFTGTELQEGDLVANRSLWKPGDYVIYGPDTGEHVDFLISPLGVDWHICGFGGAGGPSYGLLSGSESYFNTNGHPGIRVMRPK